MRDWKKETQKLNVIGAKYLGLCATGMVVWAEWLLPDGTRYRVYFD